jgi:SET domain-containing protein
MEVNSRWTIDGSPRWNTARYINHSCRPNAEAFESRGEIRIKAKRRIKAGDEITYTGPPRHRARGWDRASARGLLPMRTAQTSKPFINQFSLRMLGFLGHADDNPCHCRGIHRPVVDGQTQSRCVNHLSTLWGIS